MDIEKLEAEYFKKFTQVIRNQETGDPIMVWNETSSPFVILDWIQENFSSKTSGKRQQQYLNNLFKLRIRVVLANIAKKEKMSVDDVIEKYNIY